MSKLQWFSVFVLGFTALGVSYFYNAIPVATEEVETPVEVPEIKTTDPGDKSDPKSVCGNGVCTAPENAALCPADC